MTYVQRKIDVSISLGDGSFGDSGFNTITVSGLRVSTQIVRMGLPGLDTATIRIWGMRLDDMNKISSLGMPLIYTRKNAVLVSAGDAETGMGVVFNGTIKAAWTDFSASPDVSFVIVAFVALNEKMKPVAPSSYPGPRDVATIESSLATLMGMLFENSGVSVILSYPYFPGTALDQAIAAAKAANIGLAIDDRTNTLAIWPQGGSRGGEIPLISPATGLVGYPSYTGTGVAVRTLYNQSISFQGQVEVQSSVKPACGTWIVNKLVHTLESMLPGGQWFTDVEAYRLGNPATVAA